MVAPLGNQNSKKLTTDALKAEAYKQYCDHVASGLSKRSWCFRHPHISLTSRAMRYYIKENPLDFPPLQLELAEIEGYAVWERHIKDTAFGKNKDANPVFCQMFMRNVYKWDRHDLPLDEDDETEIMNSFATLMNQLSQKQKAIAVPES